MKPLRWRLIEHIEGDALLRRDQTGRPLAIRKPRAFVVSDDLFHPHVPDGWIDLVVAIAAAKPQHTFVAPTFNGRRAEEYWQIVTDESEEATAFRLAIAMNRGLVPKPPNGFSWPLPNLTFQIMEPKA